MNFTINLKNETETLTVAKTIAYFSEPPLVIFLQGELGAGKTTFVRGFLQGLGFFDAVKSPTFTLVEEYDCKFGKVFHFDLYRLSHPEELEFIGIRDYFTDNAIVLIEWPDKGAGFLKSPDLVLRLAGIDEEGAEEERTLLIEAKTEQSISLLQAVLNELKH